MESKLKPCPDHKELEVGIKFGCLYPTLEKQLNEYGFTLGSKAHKCERIRDAINTVRLHGIATDEESSRMYKRLMRMMSDYAEDWKQQEGE